MNSLQRYWPILYILYKFKEIYGHFFIQKYIFLAKVEEGIPIKYGFLKNSYGPYTVEIKMDFLNLREQGLIDSYFSFGLNAWVLKIKRSGENWVDENINNIPQKWKDKMDKIIVKYGNWSRRKLSDYVYENHIKSLEQDQQFIDELKSDCSIFIEKTEPLLMSHNALLLQGSLDLIMRLLRKAHKLEDPIKREQILQNIKYYLEEIGQTLAIIDGKETIITELNLNDLEEDFSLIEEIYEELEPEAAQR